MTDEVTEKIIGAAIEVHRILGSGLPESVYEGALCHELFLRDIPFKRQVDVSVSYKDANVGNQRIDLLVADEVVVELKSQRGMPDVSTAQVLSYLKATGLKHGLLLNFGEVRLIDGIKRLSL
ncbi:MAG: GxxExxY protein [Sulfuritalea sp.]|nr:GxxExxY protein [Sulfuritalea sp.]